MDLFEPVVSFFAAYFTPMVWLEQLPKLFCFICKSQSKYVATFAGLLNLFVVLAIASIAVRIVLAFNNFISYYIYNQYISSSSKAFLSKYKKEWVIISGGCEGIGLELAKNFASNKFKLVLLSNNQNNLNTAKTLLESNGCPQCDIIFVDYSKHDMEQYERVERELDMNKRKVGILINCAGTLTPMRYLHVMSHESLQRVMDVNVSSALFMTSKVLPQMHKNNKGFIVNISSMISKSIYAPYMGAYCVSKKALDQMSRCIHQEYPKLNILTLIPGAVQTSLYASINIDNAQEKTVLSAEKYSNSAFNILTACGSRSGGYYKTTGHIIHQFEHIIGVICDKLGLSEALFRAYIPQNENKLLGKTSDSQTQESRNQNQMELK